MQPDIDQLLQELRSEDPAIRIIAIEGLARLATAEERALAALRSTAASEQHPTVREAAQNALARLGFSQQQPLYVPPTRRRLRSDPDVLLGFFGWYLGNLLGFGLLSFFYDISETVSAAWGYTMLLLNLGGLIVLAFTRPRMALGMLLAFASVLALLCAVGVLFWVICYSLSATIS